MLAVELLDRLALGDFGAVARRGVESRDACAGGADALGERALRHKLQLDLARQIAVGKGFWIGRPRE